MRFGFTALALPVLAFAAAPVSAANADLSFPNGEKSVRVRVEVLDGDKSPEVAWAAFLDKLFAHFDRDGNGVLSRAEVERVFPLPRVEGGAVTPEFAAMDANHDGKVTPAEFRAFYDARGFAPVTVVVQPAPAEALALGDALFRHLDRDNDGKLSAEELRRAAKLLQRLDEDEDEVLTAKELLGTEPNLSGLTPAGVKRITDDKKPDATLRLAFGGKPTLVTDTTALRLSADGARLQVPGGVCAVVVSRDDPAAEFRAAKAFYLAQFKAAARDKPVPKAVFEDDSTAQVLVGLFDAADRDGDGQLTRAELDAFFDLIELGIGCRAIVTVTDRGRNLFDVFDENGDGRLDLGELLRAGRTAPDELARDKPLERSAVLASYRLVAGRGPVGDSFGPVPFGSTAKPKPPGAVVRGPAWFRAMDKNGDGFVSAGEFVGPTELFAKLDANGDGRISVEEAEAAKP